MSKLFGKAKLFYLGLATGIVLWSMPAYSMTMTVLDENFNDVTYSSSTASIRTVKNILDNNPGQLPYGTTWYSSNAQEDNVNVRRASNTINTSSGIYGFDSFSTPTTTASGNKFLVLGDNEGTIGGEPYGGTMRVALPFIFPSWAHSLNLSFDYSFDGKDSGTGIDYFRAFIADGESAALLDLLTLQSPGFAYGTLSTEISREDLPSHVNLFLVLELQEYTPSTGTDKTNSAAGIDNIHVIATAPEPSSFLLLGAGLISFGILGRKFRKRG